MKHAINLNCGMILIMLALTGTRSFAQCDPPSTFWQVVPATSTSLHLNWFTAPSATAYRIRYWEQAVSSDKTVINDVMPPFLLSGLKKDTKYAVQIKPVCGTAVVPWSAALSFITAKSTEVCEPPSGLAVTGYTASSLTVSWTSTGSHTLRYRPGTSGDWTIPFGGMSVVSGSFTIQNLSPVSYQIEVKKNCSLSTSAYVRVTDTPHEPCPVPMSPTITATATSATVWFPSTLGANTWNVYYRKTGANLWTTAATGVSASYYLLNPPLLPGTSYQVGIQAICSNGTSDWSIPADFTTESPAFCLADKNAGKNMDPAMSASVDEAYNRKSPYSFGSMIGINDGGLFNRAYQLASGHPLTALSTDWRLFHPMDVDFNETLLGYDQNIKPKNTVPEGVPSNLDYHQYLYEIYRNSLGFGSMTAALELLQYDGMSWKDKFYRESDWSISGAAGIRLSFRNYVASLIDALAPAGTGPSQQLISALQVGNELWDYPQEEDYHNLLSGAHDAFENKYGPKSQGGWRMKLVAGAFQAYRDGNCMEDLRDASNCGGALERHDFIGDYLDLTDCAVLRDLDAIDCHPYSFSTGSLSWTYPENPQSENRQIRNLAAWLMANRNDATGVLAQTGLWSSEYGFDSHPQSGVGEKTQLAYLIRGLMLHSRYHFQKVYFYNGFDHARENDAAYGNLYGSSGLWKLGTNPASGAASPLPEHGAQPKPSWYGLMDFKSRFGGYGFTRALVETPDARVYLITPESGAGDPYLVFWSPSATGDANIDTDIPINLPVNWSDILPEGFALSGTIAQSFATSTAPGKQFIAATDIGCGSTILTTIRRAPAFIRLSDCLACPNITDPGSVAAPNPANGVSGFDPGALISLVPATGGSTGTVEYQWQQSTDNIHFSDIPGATAESFDPPFATQTTYFRRGAKRSQCLEYRFTPVAVISILPGCAQIISFQRFPHLLPGCNAARDYYYELVISNVQTSQQFTLSGLPDNGINVPASSLNNVPFTTNSFLNQLQYVNSNSLNWLVTPANGAVQTLKLYFCWANSYAEPVSLTQAYSSCTGATQSCALGHLTTPPEDRSDIRRDQKQLLEAAPNPGRDALKIQYNGAEASNGLLRVLNTGGLEVLRLDLSGVETGSNWSFNTSTLPSGLYFVGLQADGRMESVIWEKSD